MNSIINNNDGKIEWLKLNKKHSFIVKNNWVYADSSCKRMSQHLSEENSWFLFTTVKAWLKGED